MWGVQINMNLVAMNIGNLKSDTMPEVPKFKGLKTGPFRRPTKKNEIQTLDIGTRSGSRLISKARKRPERSYVGIELSPFTPGEVRENYAIHGSTRANDYLQFCVEKGIKIRNINFDMPMPTGDAYRIDDFLRLLPKVLMPNGKVFMNSERKEFLDWVRDKALKEGYSIRIREIPIREILSHSQDKLSGVSITSFMAQFFKAYSTYQTMYQLEITYPLTLAYKTKEQRRNWTKQK